MGREVPQRAARVPGVEDLVPSRSRGSPCSHRTVAGIKESDMGR